MIKLPPEPREFPREHGHPPSPNAWGSQWKHLGTRTRPLVRSRGALRKLDQH